MRGSWTNHELGTTLPSSRACRQAVVLTVRNGRGRLEGLASPQWMHRRHGLSACRRGVALACRFWRGSRLGWRAMREARHHCGRQLRRPLVRPQPVPMPERRCMLNSYWGCPSDTRRAIFYVSQHVPSAARHVGAPSACRVPVRIRSVFGLQRASDSHHGFASR